MVRLTELLCYDRARNPSKYSVVIVSEGAMFEGGEMVFSDRTTDAYGHLKLGGIGDLVSAELKDRSAKYNKGKPIRPSTSVLATWCVAAIPTRLIRLCPWPTAISPSILSCVASTAASSS